MKGKLCRPTGWGAQLAGVVEEFGCVSVVGEGAKCGFQFGGGDILSLQWSGGMKCKRVVSPNCMLMGTRGSWVGL